MREVHRDNPQEAEGTNEINGRRRKPLPLTMPSKQIRRLKQGHVRARPCSSYSTALPSAPATRYTVCRRPPAPFPRPKLGTPFIHEQHPFPKTRNPNPFPYRILGLRCCIYCGDSTSPPTTKAVRPAGLTPRRCGAQRRHRLKLRAAGLWNHFERRRLPSQTTGS